jgi:hypothetical protein
MLSTIPGALSWLALVVCFPITAIWVRIVADGNNCWDAFAFTMVTASLGAGWLLIGLLPSGILYPTEEPNPRPVDMSHSLRIWYIPPRKTNREVRGVFYDEEKHFMRPWP